MAKQQIIFGDWGTSRLRLFLIEDGKILDKRFGVGIGKSSAPRLEILRTTLEPWRARGPLPPLVMCGMVGSRNGLLEVPYAPCPVDRAAWALRAGQMRHEDLRLTIAAGVAYDSPLAAPDVMRGEETQIFGALAIDPGLGHGARDVILPGTHSKWVRLQDGVITSFRTYPTGELYALLCDQSTLTKVNDRDEGHDAGVEAGLSRAAEGPGVLSYLFEARSAQLLRDRARGWAVGFLSGLLIGCEVAEALKQQPSGGSVLLIGETALTNLYRRALARFDRESETRAGDVCSIEGLRVLSQVVNAES